MSISESIARMFRTADAPHSNPSRAEPYSAREMRDIIDGFLKGTIGGDDDFTEHDFERFRATKEMVAQMERDLSLISMRVRKGRF